MADGGEQYEASASALGYLFQFAKALHMCIEQWTSVGLEWNVAVEAADDIEVHAGPVTDLLQLKQRAEGVRLTDTSKDLWKTLRIWSEAAAAGRVDLSQTNLFLLTTAELPKGSAGFHLQHRDSGYRDEGQALSLLRAARSASSARPRGRGARPPAGRRRARPHHRPRPPSRSMRETGPGRTGLGELDKACDHFRSEWSYGMGRIAECGSASSWAGCVIRFTDGSAVTPATVGSSAKKLVSLLNGR